MTYRLTRCTTDSPALNASSRRHLQAPHGRSSQTSKAPTSSSLATNGPARSQGPAAAADLLGQEDDVGYDADELDGIPGDDGPLTQVYAGQAQVEDMGSADPWAGLDALGGGYQVDESRVRGETLI